MEIRDHHQRSIDRLADLYRDDPRFQALIVGGSVAKGFARADSDVDFMIVASDEEFERRLASRDLFINRTDVCDYPGGYADGKVISLEFIKRVAESGNEPSRAAFEGAFTVYSHISGLAGLLRRVPVYPERGHEERIRAFYCMAFMQHWLMHEAQRHGNPYTVTRAASQLVLFTARLLLAHNRRLFPYHKWLLATLELVPDRPDDLMQTIHALLAEPTSAHATAVFDSVRTFRNWGVSDLDAYTWFMTDVEWSWMNGTTPIEDW